MDKGVVRSGEGSRRKDCRRCSLMVWPYGEDGEEQEEVDLYREGLFKEKRFGCQVGKENGAG